MGAVRSASIGFQDEHPPQTDLDYFTRAPDSGITDNKHSARSMSRKVYQETIPEEMEDEDGDMPENDVEVGGA